MKKLKEHKVQILAALALAFSLGMVAPNMAFASEDNADEGISAQATVTNATSEQLAVLVTTIKGEKDYNKYEDLYEAQVALAADLENTSEAVLKTAQEAVVAINDKAQVGDLNAADLNNFILKMQGYSDWSAMFTTMAQLEKEVGADLSQSAISDGLSPQEIANYYDSLNKFVNRVQGTLAENAVKLYDRIQTWESFKDYQEKQDLVLLATIAEMYTTKLKDLEDGEEFLKSLPEESREAAADMSMADMVEAIKKMPEYGDSETLQELVASMEEAIGMMKDALAAKVTAVLGADKNASSLSLTELVKLCNDDIEGYAKYAALAKSMMFIFETGGTVNIEDLADFTVSGITVTAEQLEEKYKSKPGELMTNYARMAQAALKIDDTVMVGLMAYELPQTSAPETPDTGIVGLIENGALDLGTLTLIVSLAAAGVLGISVIARLYTRKSMLRK